jgi:hypothetical protein
MLTDIHALADPFLCALTNINSWIHGVLSPKLDVDVVFQSCEVADWQQGCSSSSSGALIEVDDC